MAASEIEKLERMVRENPKGRLFASLADAYRKDGQYPKALEVLEAGLVNHPDYVSARVVLGRVHMSTGDRAKAREAFARVVQLDPESVIALKALADLAEEEGQGEEALRWSGQLLTVDPGNDEALKQQERLAAAAPAAVPPADAVPEVRLSGIVPMLDEPPADQEQTAAPFEAVKPPILKTKELPAIPVSGAPTFAAAPEPLEQSPEPLPIMGISEEAETEQVASSVTPMAALEPTSFEGGTDAPTERMAGLDPVGMSEEELKSISAAPGFEPNAGAGDDIPTPRTSLLGLETMSGELVGEQALPEPEAELEREQEIEISGAGAGTNEFQVDSAAETLQRRSGANEFQVASDSDTLDANSAHAAEAIETGGTDLAFIEPAYTPPPEDPEPAVLEPEPVVTESMAELYASQGHLADALDVYRQLAERDPGEPRYQERMVELEMYVGGGMPAAPAPIPVITSAPAAASTPVPAPVARPASVAGTGESVGAWLANVFAQSLPGTTPATEPAAMAPMAMAAPEPMMLEPEPEPEPTPAPVAEEPPVHDLASEAELAPAAPRGEPTRPASGAFDLSNVFEAPKPSAGGSFDDFFGAGAAPAAPSAPKAADAAPTRSTRPSGAQPPADDDVASFQDWLKGLKK